MFHMFVIVRAKTVAMVSLKNNILSKKFLFISTLLSGTFSLEIGIEQDKSKLNLNKMISFGLLLSYFSASLGNKGPRIELSLIQNQIPMNSDDEYTTIQILGSKLYHIVLS